MKGQTYGLRSSGCAYSRRSSNQCGFADASFCSGIFNGWRAGLFLLLVCYCCGQLEVDGSGFVYVSPGPSQTTGTNNVPLYLPPPLSGYSLPQFHAAGNQLTYSYDMGGGSSVHDSQADTNFQVSNLGFLGDLDYNIQSNGLNYATGTVFQTDVPFSEGGLGLQRSTLGDGSLPDQVNQLVAQMTLGSGSGSYAASGGGGHYTPYNWNELSGNDPFLNIDSVIGTGQATIALPDSNIAGQTQYGIPSAVYNPPTVSTGGTIHFPFQTISVSGHVISGTPSTLVLTEPLVGTRIIASIFNAAIIFLVVTYAFFRVVHTVRNL